MEEDVLKGKTLLVVDDENDLRDIIASELEFMGARVFQAENISIAQTILLQNKVDLVISDIRMPGGTGIDLLSIIKSRNAGVPSVMLITGFADITVEDAFDRGAEALVNKPFKLDDLIRMIARYTSPVEERFSEEVSSQKVIQVLQKGRIQVGRGGISFPIKLTGKIDIGEVVKFDFIYNDQHFEGSGACRWLKPSDQGPDEAVMGVEFLNLKSPTIDAFKVTSENKSLIPYIPSSKH